MAISTKPTPARQRPNTRKTAKSPRPRATQPGNKPRKGVARKRRPALPFWNRKNLVLIGLELSALILTALLGTVLTLGSSAQSFSGSGLFESLLPFAATVALWIFIAAVSLLTWIKLRGFLNERMSILPAIFAVSLSATTIWFVFHDGYASAFTHFRGLVGGKQQAEQITLEHQVYAAYRRHSLPQLQKMIERAIAFDDPIRQAADDFDLDVHVLQGIAAAESSFMPRNSQDGGQGLFQITAVPKQTLQEVQHRLRVNELDIADPRHNTYIAAATLQRYLAEMKGDLFLGLLAYNIGPHNGGLRFIMRQYGATDFITLQPYLKELPRDYPIRVLSYALAFKLWQEDGKLLAYQEDDNAIRIQRLGIPGMTTLF